MIDTAKSLMRKKMKRQLAALLSSVFYSEGVRGASFIQRLALWKQYETVLLFLSMPDEIDTGPLLEAALSDGKRVFVPRVMSDTPYTAPDALSLTHRSLCFFRVYSISGPWHYGAYHIREPLTMRAEDRLGPELFPSLIIVPGMAFDREGRRLGHGRGYYDRFFAELDARGLAYATIGFCLEAQLVERVPTDLYDKQMNAVCTGEAVSQKMSAS
ncbi:MAG: 5-formyltetrahydrofolate cyclo-ligase [Treponema sp.]|jgi:5-formyltetrahydrofolate cyclo-ligase|nr:5-formyltetrahydrofolate cyclo-ligase [Treponema sp.]